MDQTQTALGRIQGQLIWKDPIYVTYVCKPWSGGSLVRDYM